MPFDDVLADLNFPLFPVDPEGQNPGTPCFYNMGTFWTMQEKIPEDFDWKQWVEKLPKDVYGGPVILMNVKNKDVPYVTEVPRREKTMEWNAMAARLEEFDRMHRMCEGCRMVCMDNQPHWKKMCTDCYYSKQGPRAGSSSDAGSARKCACGTSLEKEPHWKKTCIHCWKKARRARYSPY